MQVVQKRVDVGDAIKPTSGTHDQDLSSPVVPLMCTYSSSLIVSANPIGG